MNARPRWIQDGCRRRPNYSDSLSLLLLAFVTITTTITTTDVNGVTLVPVVLVSIVKVFH